MQNTFKNLREIGGNTNRTVFIFSWAVLFLKDWDVGYTKKEFRQINCIIYFS